MSQFDSNGSPFEVGSLVNIRCKVVSAEASPAAPAIQLLNLEAVYADPDQTTRETFQVYATTVTVDR